MCREIHKQRADLMSVAHSRSPSGIPVGLVGMPTTLQASLHIKVAVPIVKLNRCSIARLDNC